MNIGEILDLVYDEDVGWRPASGSIKPVHVANGLTRAIQGGFYNNSRLHGFISVPKRREGVRQESAEYSGESGVYDSFKGPPQLVERARRYMSGLLGGDNAVFPSLDHSSFSLTTGRMVTRDPNDNGLGDFTANLLEAVGGNDSLAEIVHASVKCDRPEDPLTALAWPLLSDDFRPRIMKSRAGALRKRAHNKEFLKVITEAAADLASHERRQGNRTRTLQRAVQFACVATHAHAQALAANGSLLERPPALLSMIERRQDEIAGASEETVDLIYRSFERWLSTRLADLIEKGVPLKEGEEPFPKDTLDGRSIRPFLASLRGAERGHPLPSEQTISERMYLIKSARASLPQSSPAQVLGHALVNIYLKEYQSGGPRRFLQSIARRIGLLYPHFQGKSAEKRFRPSVPVLDMLVRACIPSGHLVPLEDFLARLWFRFGLLVGGRRTDDWDDLEILANWGIPVDGPVLAENTESLVRELEAMGLARRFPDAVAFVGDGYED